jgi:hypothetical protein
MLSFGKPGWSLARLAFVALLAALAGCDAIDTVQKGFAHSQAVSAELEKSVGLKSSVGFNWNNGSLNSVTVTFEGIPAERSLKEIGAATRAAVLKEFKQEPKQIVVAFSLNQ